MATLRGRTTWSRLPLGIVPIVTVSAGALLAGDIVVRRPAQAHLVLALVIFLALWALALTSPRAAIVTILLGLPFLALVRRLLIGYDGWHSNDPLLLVAPAVAAALVLARRSTHGRGRLSNLVAALLGLAVLESVNPLGGTLRAGLVGLLFVAAPLLWFFVGRELADRRLVSTVLGGAVACSVVVGVYGLSQTLNGLPHWDAAWLKQGGYAALNVGGTIRPFGTFSSAAEYATYIGAAIAVCLAFAFHGRVYVLALLPLLGPALFLEGSRGVLVLVVAAGIALVGLRTRRMVAAVAVIAIVVVTLGLVWRSYGSAATVAGAQSGNALVQHQVNGLSHPLDAKQSTLVAHWHLFTNGFRDALRQPLGIGTAATNLAGSRFGGVTAGTEVDVSNAFVGLGILGGLLFVAVIVTTLRRAFALYRARGDVVLFAVIGVLLVTLGQWLNGGYYALAPLVWLLVGWVERESAQLTPLRRETSG